MSLTGRAKNSLGVCHARSADWARSMQQRKFTDSRIPQVYPNGRKQGRRMLVAVCAALAVAVAALVLIRA